MSTLRDELASSGVCSSSRVMAWSGTASLRADVVKARLVCAQDLGATRRSPLVLVPCLALAFQPTFDSCQSRGFAECFPRRQLKPHRRPRRELVVCRDAWRIWVWNDSGSAPKHLHYWSYRTMPQIPTVQ